MSFNFNVSGRKEDMSIRLRAQNMRNAKGETKQLEAESRRMDERLAELKMAMTREKEERERHSQGFWGKGQTGVLASYAQDILTKTKEKGAKPKKVKVLKDEPIVTPVRKQGPGTLGFIAQQGGKENRVKVKGSRCGQCEHKAAQVTCRECGEDYCAGCFAAFHLKGALKKHRSVPLGSSARRTPRQNSNRSNGPAPSEKGEPVTTVAGAPPPRHMESPAKLADIDVTFRSSSRQSNPPGHSHNSALMPVTSNGASLLDGDYDEANSAAFFQQALNAWRGDTSSDTKAPKICQPKTQPKVPQEMVSVDCGTEEGVVSPRQRDHIDIMFHSKLSYAEKLLLKKHRRGQLVDQSPAYSASETQLRLSTGHSSDVTPSPSGNFLNSRDETQTSKKHSTPNVLKLLIDGPMDEDEESQEEKGLEFASLYNARVQSQELLKTISNAGVTVTEMASSPLSQDDWEQTTSYEVAEATSSESLASKPSSTMLSMVSSQMSDSPRLQEFGHHGEPLGGATGDAGSIGSSLRHVDSEEKVLQRSKANVQSRPQSAVKSRSQAGKESRPQSRANSRAQSRAQSRVQGYRLTPRRRPGSAASVYGEGNLTKTPSDPLKEIAQLSPRTTIQPRAEIDLGSFFTAGVQAQLEPFQERTLTPSGQRKHQVATPTGPSWDEKWKVSNKVYQMAPRSWQPESSLAENVPEDNAANHVCDIGVKHFEQFVAAPLDGNDGKEVETLSWTLSSNVVMTTSHLERPVTEGNDSSSGYSPCPQTGGSTSSGHVPSPGPGVTAMSPRLGSETPSGRRSQMIVVDGGDPSECDVTEWDRGQQDVDDIETLDQLGWELASNTTSRVPDGAASRLSMFSTNTFDEEEELSIHEDFGRTSGLSTPDVNIEDSLRQEDLADDFEDTVEETVRDEVHALPT
ncbi:hypothetical protein LSAT2_031506 [Lamellibrachia satsuma]|nr:hypothetical protein LSAT2_031506 [Lamellibrachia satsuma]